MQRAAANPPRAAAGPEPEQQSGNVKYLIFCLSHVFTWHSDVVQLSWSARRVWLFTGPQGEAGALIKVSRHVDDRQQRRSTVVVVVQYCGGSRRLRQCTLMENMYCMCISKTSLRTIKKTVISIYSALCSANRHEIWDACLWSLTFWWLPWTRSQEILKFSGTGAALSF